MHERPPHPSSSSSSSPLRCGPYADTQLADLFSALRLAIASRAVQGGLGWIGEDDELTTICLAFPCLPACGAQSSSLLLSPRERSRVVWRAGFLGVF